MKTWALLIFVKILVCLCLACGGGMPPSANQPTNVANARINEPNSTPTSNSANAMNSNNNTKNANTINEQKTVMESIDQAFDKWNPEHGEYEQTTILKNMWVAGGHHPWDYIPKGANKLISEIKVQELFKDCERAKALKVDNFAPSGNIKTVNELFKRLYYCDSNNQQGD